jgi:DeoR/GlpR family transcriptional regulator of sugar metabolism
LARRLIDVPGLTVLTNSVPVADVLYRDGRPDQTVILSGGVRTPSDALVGPFAVEVIRSLHVDTVFMGSHGMDYRTGFTTPNILEAETNRALIEAGRRLIVLADHTKWGVIGVSSVARLEDADTIITDSELDQAARSQLASVVRRLMLVDVATGDVQTIEGGGGHARETDTSRGRA